MLPARLALALSTYWFDYLPHQRPHGVARSVEPCKASVVVRGGPVVDTLLLGHTMHLVHHLFPTIPWYRLSRVYGTIRPAVLARGGREVTPWSLPRSFDETPARSRWTAEPAVRAFAAFVLMAVAATIGLGPASAADPWSEPRRGGGSSSSSSTSGSSDKEPDWLDRETYVAPPGGVRAGDEEPAPSLTGEPIADAELVDALDAALSEIDALEAKIIEREALLKATDKPVAAAELTDELERLKADLESATETLNQARLALAHAIGLDPSHPEAGSEGPLTWDQELQQLLTPAFSELSELTYKPRELARLQRAQAELERRDAAVKTAIARTEASLTSSPPPAVGRELVGLLEEYTHLEERIALELVDNATQRDRIAGHAGTWETKKGRAVDGVRQFFEARGKSVILALGVLLGVLLLVRLMQKLLRVAAGRRIRSLGAAQNKDEDRVVITLRFGEVAVLLVGVMSAVVAMLAVLYVSGDWLLLTLAVAVLVAIGWGARNGVPRFWREAQLLMNVGPVRQGERLVMDGIPWRVTSLHLITVLESPAFPETRLHLPLASMHDCHSRPVTEDERWFPTMRGDWILWDDGAAQVLSQSPDYVTLMRDRSEITVPTGDFLGSSVVNLSRGFRHRLTVTLDYAHQADVTSTIPERLEWYIRDALASGEHAAHVLAVSADFEGASDSSLDVEVEVDFDGAAADRWETLSEVMAAAAVDACTRENWCIAFPQLRLHTDEPPSVQPTPTAGTGRDQPPQGGRLVGHAPIKS